MFNRSPLLSLMLVCLLVGFMGESAWAQLKLPQVFASHMVLQRERPIAVWGWAAPGAKVTVTLGLDEQSAQADAAGAWRVDLPALEANAQGQSLVITDGSQTVTFEDILIGDNWLCSGQSNMQWAMQGGVIGAPQDIAAGDLPQIRLYQQARRAISPTPLLDTPASWKVCSPQSLPGFSAVAFYFGRMVHQEANVPIGLLDLSWSGQRIEPFTAPEGFASVPELAGYHKRVMEADPTNPLSLDAHRKYLDKMAKWIERARASIEAGQGMPNQPISPSAINTGSPAAIYNAMIHPVVPLGLKGAIWYQGESNGGEAVSYFNKSRGLILGWREVFENPDMPFYLVQLANWLKPNEDPAGGDGWAQLREAQLHTLKLPHTGMAVTIDIGDPADIHPRNKKDVGERLAQWALHQTYGQTNRVPSGPLYRGHTYEGANIRIAFDHVGSGLMVGQKVGLEPTRSVDDGQLGAFAIADDKGTWHWAKATIDGQSVVVWADGVTNPVAVRYGFSMNAAGANLYNKEGLPASPFRTDHPYGDVSIEADEAEIQP